MSKRNSNKRKPKDSVPESNTNRVNLWKAAEVGKNTDVVFVFSEYGPSTSKEPPKKKIKIEVFAHKQILIEASLKFKSLFDDFPAESYCIEDLDSKSFQMLLKSVYTNEFPDQLETVLALFRSSLKYCCDKLTLSLSNWMIQRCTMENLGAVLCFVELAWKYDDEPLKFACEKVLLENTEQVLKSSELLKVQPMVLNRLFKYPNLNIQSEKSLLVALENYIKENHKNGKDMINLIEPAIGSIRFLTMEQKDITDTFLLTEDEKKLLTNALNDEQQVQYVPRYLTTNNYVRTFVKVATYPKDFIKKMVSDIYTSACWGCEHKQNHVPVNCANMNQYLNPEVRSISLELSGLYDEKMLWHEYSPEIIDRMVDLYKRYNEIIFKINV